MKHTIYNTSLHFVEIEISKPLGNMGIKTETWQWEIILAKKGTDNKGKAVASNRNFKIGWIDLQSLNPLEEMIDACKECMNKN